MTAAAIYICLMIIYLLRGLKISLQRGKYICDKRKCIYKKQTAVKLSEYVAEMVGFEQIGSGCKY